VKDTKKKWLQRVRRQQKEPPKKCPEIPSWFSERGPVTMEEDFKRVPIFPVQEGFHLWKEVGKSPTNSSMPPSNIPLGETTGNSKKGQLPGGNSISKQLNRLRR